MPAGLAGSEPDRHGALTARRKLGSRLRVADGLGGAAGMDDLDLDRMAATVTLADGSPRFAWTDVRPDHDTYVRIVLDSIAERQRWRTQYEHAKTLAAGVSTVAQPP